MDDVSLEKAAYVITYYSNLLTAPEAKALRHYRSIIKIGGNERSSRVYLKVGWLSDNPEILDYLKDGYDQFIINCTNRILQDSPGELFFNFCPVCMRLARTPQSKQCRFCGHDWH